MKYLILAFILSYISAQHHHDVALLVDQAFVRLDVNPKDGLLELAELTSVFDNRDLDGDGNLTFTEFQHHAPDNPIRQEIFNHFDTNKDGMLDKVEFVDTNFHAMDHNGDNQVTRHDFDHYYTNIVQHLIHPNHGHAGR
ncbi:uncharacterized protein LOC133173771 [Saccostrea echinata]|uniref:uncharacterized protein LOC133173771 n=1 Tax=Saccostrea echinata TaxID=191078 RepID=UPI002A7F9F53|nr:uncharacterized protein LOC133173771 [Saccostrea echinata]